MIRVRPMTASDCPAVLRINADGQPGVAPLDSKELARLLGLTGHHIIALGPEAQTFGYMLSFTSDSEYDGEELGHFKVTLPTPFIYIDQVAVAAEARRSGVGAALYRAIEEHAREHEVGRLCCEVNTRPLNSASAAFHRKMGFHTRGALTTQDGRAVDLYLKEL